MELYTSADDAIIEIFLATLNPSEKDQVEELFARGLERASEHIVGLLYFLAAIDAWLHPTENNKMLREEAAKLGILE